MIRTVNGIVLLILHLTVCILIWAGIRSGMLKVKKYLIIPVIFVPVWGALSMLILHLQVFSKAENSRQIGVEKLQVNEEIYKNNFRSVEENDHDIVPLEEALLINDPEKRRKLIMDILNDDPSKYIELLEKARMNEDVEVVHYAITAMVELSKDYDSKLQTFERTYAAAPEDPVVLDEYCDFMEDYLSKELLSKQMEGLLRKEYEERLLQKLSHGTTAKDLVRVIHNELALGLYDLAQKHLTQLSIKSNADDVYYLYLEYYYQTGQFDEFKNMIREMQGKQVVLSKDKQDLLNFWQGKEVMA